MALIKVNAFKCDRCAHIWISEKFTHKNPPTACSKCKSAYWNRGSTNNNKKKKNDKDD